MRQIKITVTVQQEGQARRYGDTEYRYRIEVDGDLSQDKVLRFCRNCLNGGGVAYEEWLSNTRKTLDRADIESYFNGYYKFDKLTEEKDNRGVATKASYAYKVVVPYCD